jgi:hypothetical protein
MSIQYPIKFAPVAASKGVHSSAASESVSSVVSHPKFRIESLAKGGQECKEFRLAEIGGWPETKTEMETQCVDLGWPIGRICTDIPRIYHRSCTKFVYVNVCYPTGMLADVEDCVKGAALASAVAAVIASPEAAAPVFEVALKGCLAAKGATWADQVSVSAGWSSACGDWHPV